MFLSLTSRIMALGGVVIAALLAVMLALVDASMQTRSSFHWVSQSAEVIETTDLALGALRDAESGQRGFLITRNPGYARSFDEDISTSRKAMAHVVALTVDNPLQNARIRAVQPLVERRIAALRAPLDLAQRGDFERARVLVGNGPGGQLMTMVTAGADRFLAEERVLQSARVEAAGQRLDGVRRLVIGGGIVLAFLVLLVCALLARGIRRPAALVRDAMTALGDGDSDARITTRMGSREFAALAQGYNAMADRLVAAVADQRDSERKLQIANEDLRHHGDTLRERSQVIELLGGMAHRMQAARTDEELANVIRVFVPRVLPGSAGALYAHNNSRNLLVPIAGWGGIDAGRDGFAPDHCWALRRGQSHAVTEPGGDIVCAHVGDEHAVYHCEPLLAGGEVIGTLYLRGRIEADERFRLTVMAENIASALVNHRLQRGLREQTIRDPLTGLFNRRYMEETLSIEIARSRRSGAPLSVVMCDIDHFKRFNDDFGHDAGDAVLQAVSAEMLARFRDGDVICRYGGEEFTIIAPGTTAEALTDRVELVRHAIAELNVRQNGQRLGPTSMSFGIATCDPTTSRDGATLIQAADTALYRAKREGRNRTIVELRTAA